MPKEIRTVADLMTAAANALRARDQDTLAKLDTMVRGWLQSDAERLAQLEMIGAMMEACDELEEA